MFDREEGQVRVKPQFREVVTWRLGDARDAGLVGALGLQDISWWRTRSCATCTQRRQKSACAISRGWLSPAGTSSSQVLT
jgi:hypothetical protein